MVFAILKWAWKLVWVFTSPHLLDIRERFETNLWQIWEDDFVKYIEQIRVMGVQLSYFEKCTLIACLYFRDSWVEYAILEVWVWGLLDSTNIVSPLITAITSIWYDHQHLLWDSLDEISAQKAGIIKPNIPVVYNHKNEVISATATKNNAPIIFTDKKYQTNLVWEYQQKNAAIAHEIASYIWISQQNITQWLQRVEHLWRLQYLRENFLVDGAHNELWLFELKKYIENIKFNFEEVICCIWVKKWKSLDLIFNIFWEQNNYILINTEHNLCESAEKLQNSFKKEVNISSAEEIKKQAQKNPSTLYAVFGSLYMIGDFYK